VVKFDGPLQLALHLVGQGHIAQPPTPAIAGPGMDTHLPGDETRRAREAQQKGGKAPKSERPLALGEQCVSEVVEGAPTASTPVAFQLGPVRVGTPGADVGAVTPRALERAIFPPQGMEVGMTLFSTEALVDI
jgi:hypothetical protein